MRGCRRGPGLGAGGPGRVGRVGRVGPGRVGCTGWAGWGRGCGEGLACGVGWHGLVLAAWGCPSRFSLLASRFSLLASGLPGSGISLPAFAFPRPASRFRACGVRVRAVGCRVRGLLGFWLRSSPFSLRTFGLRASGSGISASGISLPAFGFPLWAFGVWDPGRRFGGLGAGFWLRGSRFWLRHLGLRLLASRSGARGRLPRSGFRVPGRRVRGLRGSGFWLWSSRSGFGSGFSPRVWSSFVRVPRGGFSPSPLRFGEPLASLGQSPVVVSLAARRFRMGRLVRGRGSLSVPWAVSVRGVS
ncbi:hypothetical protein H4W32_008106 [Actinophytocola algeriensis]|uniref:Uncharacterized protein n=1 Tax=Actinophytocola algeriensis TaxID=1768010 RepID=A0A7W7Q6T9_9PSEU|nr:hypothetical protein [Actinophytocola algeriensis]MBE1480064.1 hypothetical protein [Actinophytocola algeriensis]